MTADLKCKVIIVGSLGDLVKKIVEMDLRMSDNALKNKPLVSAMAALSKLFAEWPVSNRSECQSVVLEMKYSIIKYKEDEKNIEKLLAEVKAKKSTPSVDDAIWLITYVQSMLNRRDEIKKQIAALNKMSFGVGSPDVIPPQAHLEYEVVE